MANVLLFNKRAASHNAARVHNETCPLVAAARKSRGVVAVIESTEVASVTEDLSERDWPVKRCKCVRDDSGTGD